MSITELHPEELLQKAELTASEKALLAAHLARCVACRFEQHVRRDFAAESTCRARTAKLVSPEALEQAVHVARTSAEYELSQARMRAAAAAADIATHDPPVVPPAELVLAPASKRIGSTSPNRSRAATVLLAFAALTLATAAVAASAKQLIGGNDVTPLPAPATHTGFEMPLPAQPKGALPPAPAASDSAAAIDLESLRAAPAVASDAPFRIAMSATSLPNAAAFNPRATARPEATERPSPSRVESAQVMFSSANEARYRGDHAAARRLYRQLLQSYPASAEAAATRVALGRLELDSGHATEALVLYNAYLASGGALREQALVGKARALGALGRTTEEANAWSTLMAEYPTSIHTDAARARVRELATK
jgi:TolA-binding protein